jgi:integrase
MKAVRLPGIPGDEQFMAAYHAALAGSSNAPADIGASRTAPGTVAALVANYFKSAAWLDLAKDTRTTRWRLLERFREQHGDKRVALLRRDHFEKMLSEIPSLAMKDRWLRAIRGLMKSGVPSMLKDDPTIGLKLKRAKSKGHHTWTEAEITQYRAYHPLGTQARLVLEFALESASRKGEIVRLGPQHLYQGRNGEWRIRIARTKGSRDVDILMSAELLAAVQAMPKAGLAYIVGEKGGVLSKITLGHRFREWAIEASLPKHCRLHGLKKSGMVEIALAGGTAPELMAVSGHRSMVEAQRYIEEAFARPELADGALRKVRTKRGGSDTNTGPFAHKHDKKPA